ncbi:hypothetical protein SMC26_07320 [Actinomadura fulvescens]|uniref:DUF676 domain-containing protein n=1 Tax=Actinomadura fulvescens TaxID=46160 RepID=A0ABP6C410_9ACTN
MNRELQDYEQLAVHVLSSLGVVGGPETIEFAAPEPDETWDLGPGTAWVYYGEGNTGLVRPVLVADGYNAGPSDLDLSYAHLEHQGFQLISELRSRGRDLIIVGFDERSASLLRNAEAVSAAVRRAISSRTGNAPLVAGGFSMGGLIMRYALAEMEHEGLDHETGIYFSYDAPHTGAWLPISLQAFAHWIRRLAPGFSNQVNSPASRQLLIRHIGSVHAKPRQDPLRVDFLAKLDRVGGWPQRPHRIGVANGSGNGTGNGVPPGELAVRSRGPIGKVRLYTQDSGKNALVASFKGLLTPREMVRTRGLLEFDGAPGGTLSSFEILAGVLQYLGEVETFHSTICFSPSVSAVAIRDLVHHEDLYADISKLDPADSGLHEFKCASRNERHTEIDTELCAWLLERLD